MPILKNAKHERFAREYVVDHNATQAALRAGYAAKSAHSQGHDFLRKPEIAARVAELDAKTLRQVDITAERVVLEIARLAFSDARKLMGPDGRLLPLHEVDDDTAAALASVEVETRPETKGRGKARKTTTVVTSKVRMWDKNSSLRMLAQRFKLIGSEADEALNNLAMSFAERVTAAQARMKTGGKP